MVIYKSIQGHLTLYYIYYLIYKIFMFEEIIYSLFYFLLFNFPSWNFFYDWIWFEVWFLLFNNQIISWIIWFFIIYIIHLWLLLLWRLLYKKLNLKRKNYWNIYFLAFVLRIFPILSIFASILLWMNDEKLSKVIKIFSIWFILYTIVWFILYNFYHLSWENLLGYLF